MIGKSVGNALSKAGNALSNHPFIVAGAGAAMAVNSMNPSEGAVDMGLDLAYGTPEWDGAQADNLLIGRDVRFRELFGSIIPGNDLIPTTPHPIRDFRDALTAESLENAAAMTQLDNGQYVSEAWGGDGTLGAGGGMRAQIATQAYSDFTEKGYVQDEFASMVSGNPYRRKHANTYASGDMVFGLYNGRR